MSYVQDTHWNEKIVMAHIEAAANIHRRLPELRVQGYGSLWPETLKDDWERYYDAVHGKTRSGPPMPQEVSYHEEVMDWLRWLACEHQQIIWMRANRIPWKVIVDKMDKSKATLARYQQNGLNKIAAILEATQTGSDHA